MDDCFPLNGNTDDPRVKDIDGLLNTYINAVSLIEFAGPTFISNLLRRTLEIATINA
jgi:hypothetical protein